MTTELIESAGQALTAPTDTSPGALMAIALSKGADITVLERLMALQERYDDRQIMLQAYEAKKLFVASMGAFKAEPLVIYKRQSVGFTNRDGDFVGYKHAGLADVTSEVVPAMARHGLSHRWDVEQTKDLITVHCVITHNSGHSERITMSGPPDNSGKKNAIQSVASTVSYLQRYTLLAATGMATTDENDDDGRGGSDDDGDDSGTPPPPPPPPPPPQDDGLPLCTPEKFEAHREEYRAMVQSGRVTAERMIRNLSTKTQLSEAQKATIRAFENFEDANPIAGNPQ